MKKRREKATPPWISPAIQLAGQVVQLLILLVSSGKCGH